MAVKRTSAKAWCSEIRALFGILRHFWTTRLPAVTVSCPTTPAPTVGKTLLTARARSDADCACVVIMHKYSLPDSPSQAGARSRYRTSRRPGRCRWRPMIGQLPTAWKVKSGCPGRSNQAATHCSTTLNLRAALPTKSARDLTKAVFPSGINLVCRKEAVKMVKGILYPPKKS